MPTDFTQIIFDPVSHTYTYGNRLLIGATRHLAQLKKPFDRQPWARREAEKLGIPVETFLKEQDEDFRRRMQRGDDVHNWIAHTLRQELSLPSSPSLGGTGGGQAGGFPEIHAFKDFWSQTRPSAAIHQVEWVIGDAELGLAGTTDALLFNQETQTYHLWDWKTGTKFKTENHFQNLLPPFPDLNDCDLVNYSLQLSLYRLMIERNTDLTLGDSYLLYLPATGGYLVYTALDLRQRLLEWLSPRPLGEGAGGEG